MLEDYSTLKQMPGQSTLPDESIGQLDLFSANYHRHYDKIKNASAKQDRIFQQHLQMYALPESKRRQSEMLRQ
jgi:hypothetical protein